MPFRDSGFDTYSHFGILRSVKDHIGLGQDLTPEMFPGLYEGNVRSGLNFVIISLISVLPGSSNTFAFYIFGLLGMTMFLIGIYFLTWTLSGSHRAAFIASLISLILCGFDVIPHGNSFTFVEILIDAHYASVLAMGLMMFAIALNIRYLDKGGRGLYALQLLLGALIFNIHILTGVEYFLILVILVVVYATKNKRLAREHLLLLSLIPAILLIASLWPLYRWWSIFTVEEVPAASVRFASFTNFLERNVLYFIGLPFLFKNQRERLFLLSWTLIFILISLSFVLPIPASFYWIFGRFSNVMRIPLVIGLALGLGVDIWALTTRRRIIIPVILVIVLSFLGISMWRTVLRYQKVMETNAYERIEPFVDTAGDGANLISYPTPSYNLMGLSNYNVYSIMPGHFQDILVKERNRELDDLFASLDADSWKEILEEYSVEQVLVKHSVPYRDARILLRDTQMLLNGVRMQRNEDFELYRVDAAELDTEVLRETPDPELELSAEEYGYTRFAAWADLQYQGTGDILVEAVKEPGDEGRTYLRATSEDPEGSLLFINRGYIEIDPEQRYIIDLDMRVTEGEPDTFVVLYQYDQPDCGDMINEDISKIFKVDEGWIHRYKIVGPAGEKRVNMVLDDRTRFVKIGLLLCHESVGQIEVDDIEISLYVPPQTEN